MNKEKLSKLLSDAIHRNVIVYDSCDNKGIFTRRLARLLIDNCPRNGVFPKMFVVPANNSGFEMFEDFYNPTSFQYPPENLTLYGKDVYFVQEREYDELLEEFRRAEACLCNVDENLCLCGDENAMLLGSF